MSPISTRFSICAMFAAVFLLFSGCGVQRTNEALPPLLKIGVLPDESKEKLAQRYEPLRKHLSDTLGLPCELVFPDSYDALVESFGAGTVDLAFFGGLTFVQATTAYDAVPLVMRDIDTRFTSYFVARSDSAATSIADYKDSVFAFGSRFSTSGHLMPRHFLALQDITPETFFREVRYSGAHDVTVEWVRDGTVALGAVNPHVFREMVADGRIEKSEFRIVWETPPYSNYVLAVQSTLGRTGRNKLRGAFLLLSPARNEHKEILRNMDAGGFFPADVETFSCLKEIATSMELLK